MAAKDLSILVEDPGRLHGPIVRLGKKVRVGITDFIHMEVSGSIVLLIATLVALVLANSPLADAYFAFWQTRIGIQIGNFQLIETLEHWINDFLMAIFFFVVGLEIKREIIVGELSSVRKATLPLIAAFGGMVIPAVVYIIFNAEGLGATGWGVPMATDIAFALGVLALLGSRIPSSLKVFLTALAIGDDIGAILVIALFYTDTILWQWLIIAAVLLLVMIFFNMVKSRSRLLLALAAIGVWFAIFESGIHATVAGVLIAFTIPARARHSQIEFVAWGREQIDAIERLDNLGAHDLDKREQQMVAEALRKATRHIQSPILRVEHALHPLASFVILPLFALANAGVQVTGDNIREQIFSPVGLGIILGLVVGKQLGITLFTLLATKLGLADLPEGISWSQIYGASWLAGIGFTMSIFITGLAFTDPNVLAQAKLAILIASLIAGIGGYLWLYLINQPQVAKESFEEGRQAELEPHDREARQ